MIGNDQIPMRMQDAWKLIFHASADPLLLARMNQNGGNLSGRGIDGLFICPRIRILRTLVLLMLHD